LRKRDDEDRLVRRITHLRTLLWHTEEGEIVITLKEFMPKLKTNLSRCGLLAREQPACTDRFVQDTEPPSPKGLRGTTFAWCVAHPLTTGCRCLSVLEGERQRIANRRHPGPFVARLD